MAYMVSSKAKPENNPIYVVNIELQHIILDCEWNKNIYMLRQSNFVVYKSFKVVFIYVASNIKMIEFKRNSNSIYSFELYIYMSQIMPSLCLMCGWIDCTMIDV